MAKLLLIRNIKNVARLSEDHVDDVTGTVQLLLDISRGVQVGGVFDKSSARQKS